LSPAALAAAKLAAKTWKPKPMDPQANAIQLPSHGWAAQADESPAQAASAEIVRMTQKLLSELGYSPGPADGHWGPNSQNALKAFQRSAGLPETGLITPQVVRAMQQTLG
jgi:localization factor PodJL